jgi:hypothetical protein
MKSRQGYKGYVIVARSYELKDGGFSAKVFHSGTMRASICVLAHLLDAGLARTPASLTSVFMACFTQFPFVQYARLSFVTPSNA